MTMPPKADGRDVLAIIPCLNEAAHLAGLLENLLGECALPEMLIVVADGGSTDGSRDIVHDFSARYSRVRLLENAKRIQSAGVNLAAETYGAGRKWIVRLDGHSRYSADFVTRLIETAQRERADSVVVPMHAQGVGCFQKAAATAQNSRIGTGGAAHRMRGQSGWVDHGHHALFRLDTFLGLGGYNESFTHNEDAEFDVRLVRSGGMIWLEDSLVIEYYPRSTAISLLKQYYRYGAGRAKTTMLHNNKLKLRQILPLCVAPAVVGSPLGWLLWPLAVPAAVWAAGCLLSGVVVGLSGGGGCGMLSGVPAMIMQLGWSFGFIRQLFRPRPSAAEFVTCAQ